MTRKIAMRRGNAGGVAGFTLIELLVVIGIIATLISILLPVMGKVRKQAYAVQCQSNLREIGSAFANYLANNKGGMMATTTDVVGGTTVIKNWYKTSSNDTNFEYGFLAPYGVKGRKIHQCGALFEYGITYDDNYNTASPYGWNRIIGESRLSTRQGFSMSRVQIPRETVLLADMTFRNPMNGQYSLQFEIWEPRAIYPTYGVNAVQTNPDDARAFTYPLFHGRHKNKGNVLWMDWHVSAEEPIYPATGAYGTAAQRAKYLEGQVGYLMNADRGWANNIQANWYFSLRKENPYAGR